jgi:hypothetical protein
MRGLGTILSFAVLAVAAGGASLGTTRAAQLNHRLPEFSCRASEIYGGQHDRGALIDVTEGNPNPLRFFRIKNDGPGVDVIAPSDSSFLARYAESPGWARVPFHFYWSESDDFLVWAGLQTWLWRGPSIMPERRPEFEPVNYDLRGTMYSVDDVVPEHIGDTARLASDGINHHLLEFNLRTGTFRRLPVSVGPNPFWGLAWTSNDIFFRVRHHLVRGNLYLDIFDSKAQEWTEFSPQQLPFDSKLLMFRLNPQNKTPEAIISWRDRRNVDHIGTITQGTAAPKELDSGQFEHVHVSPDRIQLLGLTESSGQFHRLKGELYSARTSFWLDKFEKIRWLEKFYLQENAKYAFVKVNDPLGEVKIAVWERKGDEVEPIGTICADRVDPSIDTRKSRKGR